jgi:NAD(P)H-hydrate epimerase
MKILSAEQTRAADAYPIANEPIASIDLMERASRQLYYWFLDCFPDKPEVVIFCGKGNNGGDGLALSRMLLLSGFKVQTLIVEHSKNSSADFQKNFSRLQQLNSNLQSVDNQQSFPEIPKDSIIVDAILGSGLNQPLKGLIKDIVSEINTLANYKVAIDIPTGLYADDNSESELTHVLKADYTLSFQAPKLSFLFPETGSYCGEFEILDIGLSSVFLENVESNFYFLTDRIIESYFKQKPKFAHKGMNGHAEIIGGSYGKIGAVVLASRACLKTGAGLVTAQVPECGVEVLQISNPAVMARTGVGKNLFEEMVVASDRFYGFGPGLGTDVSTQNALLKALGKLHRPCVIDADGLNILAAKNAWDLVPEDSILTPHIGELNRMVGKQNSSLDYIDAAKELANKCQVYILIKGAHSHLVCPNGEVVFNNTGNPGMATAGSGDVLTGTITSFLTQGYSSKEAALLGMYFHGLAGDLGNLELGLHGLTATDIVDQIPVAIKAFEG